MTTTKIARAQRIYSILLSIVIILAGVLFAISCLSIYNSGEEPYSRESIAKAFSQISLPIYICLAMLVLSFIIDFFSPFSQGKKKNSIAYNLILERLIAKKSTSNESDSEIVQHIIKERTNRKRNTIIRFALLSILSVIFLIYAVNVNNYHQTLMNESMINAMWIFVPCLVIAFAYTVYTVYYAEGSIKREIELLKKLPDTNSVNNTTVCNDDTTVSTKSKCKLDKVACIRIAVLVIAIFLLVFGYISGGSDGVLGKAIAICTECIGLG